MDRIFLLAGGVRQFWGPKATTAPKSTSRGSCVPLSMGDYTRIKGVNKSWCTSIYMSNVSIKFHREWNGRNIRTWRRKREAMPAERRKRVPRSCNKFRRRTWRDRYSTSWAGSVHPTTEPWRRGADHRTSRTGIQTPAAETTSICERNSPICRINIYSWYVRIRTLFTDIYKKYWSVFAHFFVILHVYF